VAVVTLQPMAIYSKAIQSTAVLVALFVYLAPTTIGGLLSAIGIAGADRMVQRNVLAMSGRAVVAGERGPAPRPRLRVSLRPGVGRRRT
jgi:potassium-transporting ATPase ATP-binding subunit